MLSKFVVIITAVLFTVAARANIDCTVKIVSKDKIETSKVELSKIIKGKLQTSYESDLDRFKFTAMIPNDSANGLIQTLEIVDKKTHLKAFSYFGGMKPAGPDAVFTVALANDTTGKTSTPTAKLTCKLK